MSTESRSLSVVTAAPLTVAALRERSQHVQALIKDLMVEDVHYMVIPGTKNRSLTKQGSEMLLSAFHISVDPQILDKSDADAVRYEIRLTGTHMGSGIVVGVGIGRCSSNEEKYKWRAAVCVEEWEAAPESRRRIKWANGQRGVYTTQQIRTNPEDLANTVLKMAKKRAQADLCLTALAASDAFRPQPRPANTQPEKSQVRDAARARPDQQSTPATTNVQSGNATSDAPRPATSAQLGLLKKKIDEAGVPENAFLAQFQLGRIEEMPFAQIDEALAWIRGLAP